MSIRGQGRRISFGPISRLLMSWAPTTVSRLIRMDLGIRKPPMGAVSRKKSSTVERSLKRNRESIMKSSGWMILLAGAWAATALSLRAEELDPKYKEAVDKGLA